MILSSAPPRHTRSFAERAQGALLALLVQTGFIAMLLLSSQHSPPLRNPAHETILLLHPTPQTAPRQIDARGPAQPRIAPIPIPTTPNVAPSPDIAPPSGIAGFGRSLFGCAPEHYADMLPDERAHCPKPGEGMAVNQPPDLLAPPRSHSKTEAMWQEQWAEDHWVPPVCPPGPPGAVARCVLEQSIAENRRREAAWARIAEQQAQDLKPKPPPVPIPFRRSGK